MAADRIYLSPPDMTGLERQRLIDAFDSNWISSVGPELGAFEQGLAAWTGRRNAAALSSGTAALHLALVLIGVEPDDEVVVPSLTFVATANAVLIAGATPVFVDSSPDDWTIDPDLLEQLLADRAAAGRLPRAVMSVDLYGQCADYERLDAICARYGLPLIADAAEALGARRNDRPAGSSGRMAVLSFNGNKIVTTGGGGALLADEPALIERARHLATQSREPAPHYQHVEPGFNYRMTNPLAAIGVAQLDRLETMLKRRATINDVYRAALGGFEGVEFMPIPAGSEPNHWLTVITVDRAVNGVGPDEIRVALEQENIESRPAWKPMHLQPLFAGAEAIGGALSASIFESGLCLPSGSSLSDADLQRVLSIVVDQLGG